jgi:hypothetical protein
LRAWLAQQQNTLLGSLETIEAASTKEPTYAGEEAVV